MRKPFLAVVCLSIVLCGCTKTNAQIMRMQKLEEGVTTAPSSVEEIQAAIQKYKERVADIQLANAQVGMWYKLLGTRYLENKMYGEALKAYQSALQYYPDNQNLYCYVGICAGFMAHTGVGDPAEKLRYLRMAEEAQLRAIQIEPRYTRALYALGLLYTKELKEYDKAIPYLEKLLTIDTKDVQAMMYLAEAYYMEQEYDKASALYDTVLATSKDEGVRSLAQENKQTVMNAAYAN